MGALSRIIEKSLESRSTSSNPSQWLIDWISGGAESSSGVTVNEDTALNYTPFWASVRIISGTLASLPFLTYRRVGDGGKERAVDHPVYRLLHGRPNEYMDIVTFLETRQAQVLAYGNAYAEIQRLWNGRPIRLWPLLPDRTSRDIDNNGVPFYKVRPLDGGKEVILPDYNVLHIKGLGFDSYTGYNIVSKHKEAIGYGVAVKEYASRFFGGDGSPSGVLEHPESLGAEAATRLKESWAAAHKGLSNAHRLQVLEEGMKWKATGIDPEKAQALDTQKFTVDDCSRIFNIPPHKLGSLDRATFSNIESQQIDFVTSTMCYWFRKWEAECDYKLFMPSERDNMFCEILVDGLLRGDTESRYNAYNLGRMAGFLSVNDIRSKENLNPIGEDGDIYLTPLNMVPAGTDVTQDNDDDGSDDDDGLRRILRDMIETQVRRIVTKRVKSPHEDTQKFIAWSERILTGPVEAYVASVKGLNVATEDVLKRFLMEFAREDTLIKRAQIGPLTDRVIHLLGSGDNKNG